MATASYIGCSQCAEILQAALEASGRYRYLLGCLEAAHIRDDTRVNLVRLRARIDQAAQRRDNAVMQLGVHRLTHANAITAA
jgi:hypothetical protein